MTDAAWQPIDTAPKDEDVIVYTRSWGPIIARLDAEFNEWLSRMQVPVSLKGENDAPSHWWPLPEPPDGVEVDETLPKTAAKADA